MILMYVWIFIAPTLQIDGVFSFSVCMLGSMKHGRVRLKVFFGFSVCMFGSM